MNPLQLTPYCSQMKKLKETQRSSVRFGFDGHVYKRYFGPTARMRFENETRVLRYLEQKGCAFVPRLVAACDERLEVAMTSCGAEAPMVSESKVAELFKSLDADFGVLHDDPFARNVTYDGRLGSFCVIDFEYATIRELSKGYTISDEEAALRFAGEN